MFFLSLLNPENDNNRNNIFGRIKNYGHKEYNSGLEIISLFGEFNNELLKNTKKENIFSNLIKDAIDKLSKNKKYDAYKLTKFEFKEPIKNSQSFIVNIINKINEEFIESNKNINIPYTKSNRNEYNDYKEIEKKINLESKAFNIFSIISKTYSNEKCCKSFDKYIFKYNIQQLISLENQTEEYCGFSDILNENFKIKIENINICPYCHKTIIKKEETKIMKLPKILIFTIINKKEIFIKPDLFIDMKNYIDSTLKEYNTGYKLFVINMWNNHNVDCIVKRKEKWYEISEINEIKEIDRLGFNNNICGLFYEKVIK